MILKIDISFDFSRTNFFLKEGLAALADLALTTKDKSNLIELLAKNAEGKLSSAEMVVLDTLLIEYVPAD
ncbi:MAG: hypothetical protein ACKO5E_09480 [bacterium]